MSLITTCAAALSNPDIFGPGTLYFEVYIGISAVFIYAYSGAPFPEAATGYPLVNLACFIYMMIALRHNPPPVSEGIAIIDIMLMHACAASLILATTWDDHENTSKLRRVAIKVFECSVSLAHAITIILTIYLYSRSPQDQACKGVPPSIGWSLTRIILQTCSELGFITVHLTPLLARWIFLELRIQLSGIGSSLRTWSLWPVAVNDVPVNPLLPGVASAYPIRRFTWTTMHVLVVAAVGYAYLVNEIQSIRHFYGVRAEGWAAYGQIAPISKTVALVVFLSVVAGAHHFVPSWLSSGNSTSNATNGFVAAPTPPVSPTPTAFSPSPPPQAHLSPSSSPQPTSYPPQPANTP